MKKFVLISLLVILSGPIIACTIFTARNGRSVLVGNNEDFTPGIKTYLWVRPAQKRMNGYVFWGFKEKYPEGGMNDHGLFIDAAALPEKIAILRDPSKPDFNGYLIEKILKECATVADAITLVQRYNLTWQEKAQIMITDKSGDYAIVHANYIIHKEADVFALTNFSLQHAPVNEYTCWRRSTVLSELTRHSISVDLFRDILQKTAQREPDNATVYSQICNLSDGIIYLYQQHDFDKPYTISLSTLLTKGRQNILMSTLFPRSIGTRMEREIKKSGVSNALKVYDKLKNASDKTAYDFSEKELDNLAYKLLNEKNFVPSIAMFTLNMQVYPASASAISGLANALLLSGAQQKADTLYQKAQQMDASNLYAGILTHQKDSLLSFRLNGFDAASQIQIHLKSLSSDARVTAELTLSAPGTWEAKLKLPPGQYSYIYKVDEAWMVDPGNKLTVKAGKYLNSYLVAR